MRRPAYIPLQEHTLPVHFFEPHAFTMLQIVLPPGGITVQPCALVPGQRFLHVVVVVVVPVLVLVDL